MAQYQNSRLNGFQHTAARRRLHRPNVGIVICNRNGFNTQPRGGGCNLFILSIYALLLFQHTAARRRLRNNNKI